MIASFSADPSDLSDAIAYELDAIEYLRSTLYGQREAPIGGMELVLGDLTPDGEQRRIAQVQATSSISEGAVRAALDRLRPLGFSAAFKLQDMVVEWILRANGVTYWPFSKKLAAYDKLCQAGSLAEPHMFSAKPHLARAFWELYRFLVPFRGTVVHSGGLMLESDGTIKMIARDSSTLRLSPDELGSYMRAMCVTSKILSSQVSTNPFLEALIHADLFNLENYHSQAGLSIRRTRLEALTVHVPPSHIVTQYPLEVAIDFDHLRRSMEKTYPVGVDGRLYFSVSIVVRAEKREAVWQLPIESVPNGLVTLREGNDQFDRFLRIATDRPTL